jgi:hypothetical protein
LRNKDPPTFYNKTPIDQLFETAWPRYYDPKGPAVYIFSSCASVTQPTKEAHVERWAKIASVQAKRILEGWSMGLLGLGGVPGQNISLNELASKLKKSSMIEPQVSNIYEFTTPNNNLNLKMIYPEEEFGSMNIYTSSNNKNNNNTRNNRNNRIKRSKHERKTRRLY